MRRTSKEIAKEIFNCHCALEPEMLTCDGELSRNEVEVRRTRLNAKLQTLYREYGRELGMMEAHRLS